MENTSKKTEYLFILVINSSLKGKNHSFAEKTFIKFICGTIFEVINRHIYKKVEMEVITYSLKDNQDKEFYEQLSLFSDKIIEEASHYFYKEITFYKTYLKEIYKDEILSDDEYLIEFITSGVFLDKYASYAVSSNSISALVLYNLYLLRNKFAFTKPVVDYLRGHLSGILLYSINLKTFKYNSEVFARLIIWLKATGEFSEEIKRLEFWNQYYYSLPEERARELINKSVAFAKYIQEQGKLYLGSFTHNVHHFLEYEHKKHKNREDYLFCGRSEAEYHLNMFGAEILNRKLRQGFNQTQKKTVLLPTCMSNPNSGKCKAIKNGSKIKCRSCSKNCEINKLQDSLKETGVDTYLVPHSSNFSEYLKNWQYQEVTGLVGVACVLNLLSGGYEMQGLKIPSQCVFLDYCGCKKHWHNKGIPTSLNHSQLEKILKKETNNALLEKDYEKLITSENLA